MNLVYLAPRQASPLQWLHQWHHSPLRSKCVPSPGSHLPYVFIWLQECVDAIHNPAEESPIEGLRHGIPDVGSPVHRVGSDNGLAPGDHTVGRESLQELFGADAEYTGSWEKRVNTILNMTPRFHTAHASPHLQHPGCARLHSRGFMVQTSKVPNFKKPLDCTAQLPNFLNVPHEYLANKGRGI